MTIRQEALDFASKADFSGFLAVCDKATTKHANDPDQLLDIGALLLQFGFLTKARQCFEQVRAISFSSGNGPFSFWLRQSSQLFRQRIDIRLLIIA